ncbi:MAG: hypothetical protein ACRCXT_12360 [Paraclostridium sp.]
MKCLRCEGKMKFLKGYRFDSQDNNRGVFGFLFDIEDHLVFDVHVCPKCRKTEFIYKASLGALGSMWDE